MTKYRNQIKYQYNSNLVPFKSALVIIGTGHPEGRKILGKEEGITFKKWIGHQTNTLVHGKI